MTLFIGMTITYIILNIVGALIYQNILEWVLHKYVLHGLGKKKGSKFSFHWNVHHRTVRQSNYYDKDYSLPWYKLNAKSSEVISLFLLWVLHLPLLFIFPICFAVLTAGTLLYYQLHKRSHSNVEWGKKYLPWHYDHHMVGNQNHNWCVTFPLTDYILKTRIKK
jgi:hypothetical protein